MEAGRFLRRRGLNRFLIGGLECLVPGPSHLAMTAIGAGRSGAVRPARPLGELKMAEQGETEQGKISTDWMRESRMGLFIHWGLYSVPARQLGKNSLAEWVKNRERLSDKDYSSFFAHFDPDLYDPGCLGERGRAMRGCAISSSLPSTTRVSASGTPSSPTTKPPIPRPDVTFLRPMVEAFRAGGTARGLLPLAHRLAPPRFPRRWLPPPT